MSSTLAQLVESSCLEASQHFSISPFRLAVAPWMSNRSKIDLAVKVLDILHEGVARELCAVVGDDPVGYSKMANYSFELLPLPATL